MRRRTRLPRARATPFSTISNEQCNAMSADDATGDLFLSCVDATSGNQYIRHILARPAAPARA
jgi:hypothetical protein